MSKVPGKKEAKRFFNYPYEALEEIICNAFYHRDYREHEPVDIVIEPDFISVSNVGGPDRAVKMEDFESGTPKPRRYRNRRLGDFLKELDLTEGKSTGITTVRSKLKSNGSPAAIYEFDEERTWFCATIKIHPEFPASSNDSQNDSQNDIINDALSKLSARRQKVLSLIDNNRQISIAVIGKKLRISPATVNRDIKSINEVIKVYWLGPSKSGRWEIHELK